MVTAVLEAGVIARDDAPGVLDAPEALEALDGGDAALIAGGGPGGVAIRRYRLTYDDGSEPEVVQASTPAEAVLLREHIRLPSGIEWLDVASTILRRPRRDPYPLLGRIWGDRLFEDA